MKFFMKLNVLSIIYAFAFFVNVELMFNVYRISRITEWNLGAVVKTTGIFTVIWFIVCAVLFYYLLKHWMEGRRDSFWAIFLWFPYYVLFILSFAYLFPYTYGGDKSNPASGLIAIGEIIFYPVYLAILTFMGISFSNPKEDV